MQHFFFVVKSLSRKTLGKFVVTLPLVLATFVLQQNITIAEDTQTQLYIRYTAIITKETKDIVCSGMEVTNGMTSWIFIVLQLRYSMESGHNVELPLLKIIWYFLTLLQLIQQQHKAETVSLWKYYQESNIKVCETKRAHSCSHCSQERQGEGGFV